MGSISLRGLTFKAYHGYYDEEREQGNHFEVNLSVTTNFEEAAATDELIGTVDYETLYTIVREEMEQPSKLLEHVVKRIVDSIFHSLPAVKTVKVSLSKKNAPIGGPCREAVVTLKKKR